MNYEEVLSMMLAHTCPSTTVEDNYKEFYYDLHCLTFKIVAKCTDAYEEADGKPKYIYHIKEYEILPAS